ncbi:MAG: YafY family transcriptional regulator [Lachnospiraceae bacterium]|nr:YafY family transcriptional regulator [Lachnospiraceae bacterium]
MKVDRLIGIITILQQKGKVTAPYLAEKFEVSRRTIQRDIEDICRAGVPIVTTQGTDGGIEIMEGFQLDTTVFTKDELQAILIGLKSLDSVAALPGTKKLAEKIGSTPLQQDEILIDLSSFYKDSLAEKIQLLRTAIREKRCVEFCYYYNKGEEKKCIEPARIVFQWSNWYVFGFCSERNGFRLYKLNRLWELCLTEHSFVEREIPEEKLHFGKNMTDDIIVPAIYEVSEKYRLIEEYGPECYRVLEDGRLYTEWGFSSYERALSWFLSFGERVTVLGPENLKQQLRESVKNILAKYEET